MKLFELLDTTGRFGGRGNGDSAGGNGGDDNHYLYIMRDETHVSIVTDAQDHKEVIDAIMDCAKQKYAFLSKPGGVLQKVPFKKFCNDLQFWMEMANHSDGYLAEITEEQCKEWEESGNFTTDLTSLHDFAKTQAGSLIDYVLKAGHPEKQKRLHKDVSAHATYAIDVTHEHFHDDKQDAVLLAQYLDVAAKYCAFTNHPKWPALESKLLRFASLDLPSMALVAVKFYGGKWPEAEAQIQKRNGNMEQYQQQLIAAKQAIQAHQQKRF